MLKKLPWAAPVSVLMAFTAAASVAERAGAGVLARWRLDPQLRTLVPPKLAHPHGNVSTVKLGIVAYAIVLPGRHK